MTKTSFASRLQELLDFYGIKAADLSKKTGISKSSISHYLKGDWEAKQDTLMIIADAYNVSEAWLMGYDVNMKKEPAEKNYSELEKKLIEDFRKVSADDQPRVLEMVKVFKKRR